MTDAEKIAAGLSREQARWIYVLRADIARFVPLEIEQAFVANGCVTVKTPNLGGSEVRITRLGRKVADYLRDHPLPPPPPVGTPVPEADFEKTKSRG